MPPLGWASDPSISFLCSPELLRGSLERAGLIVQGWEDKTRHSLDWYASLAKRSGAGSQSSLGLHLLMGENFEQKVGNFVRNLHEGRVVVQALAERGEVAP